jgi:hypothetical protein
MAVLLSILNFTSVPQNFVKIQVTIFYEDNKSYIHVLALSKRKVNEQRYQMGHRLLTNIC